MKAKLISFLHILVFSFSDLRKGHKHVAGKKLHLRALAKITSESFSYEVCNHAETLEEEEAHEKSYFSTLNSNVHSPSNNNTGNSYFQGYKCIYDMYPSKNSYIVIAKRI